jgi:hypothetical protein
MARLFERLLIVFTILCGIVYGARLIRVAHVHGVEITGSALGFAQACIAVAVILLAVVPAILSVLEAFDGRKTHAKLVLGELVAALLLFGASGHVLRQSVHAHIVGTGDARVLAVRASATTEVVE